MSPGLYRGKESSSSVPQESVESSSLPFSAVWLVSPCRRAAVPPCRKVGSHIRAANLATGCDQGQASFVRIVHGG